MQLRNRNIGDKIKSSFKANGRYKKKREKSTRANPDLKPISFRNSSRLTLAEHLKNQYYTQVKNACCYYEKRNGRTSRDYWKDNEDYGPWTMGMDPGQGEISSVCTSDTSLKQEIDFEFKELKLISHLDAEIKIYLPDYEDFLNFDFDFNTIDVGTEEFEQLKNGDNSIEEWKWILPENHECFINEFGTDSPTGIIALSFIAEKWNKRLGDDVCDWKGAISDLIHLDQCDIENIEADFVFPDDSCLHSLEGIEFLSSEDTESHLGLINYDPHLHTASKTEC